MRNDRVALLVLLFAAALAAQDKSKPDTPDRAADKVLAALKATDQKTLQVLAAKDSPNPWLVADQLSLRSAHDAAEALAKDGARGLPAATALNRAQEYVASYEKWKHPYYWAAWQLWGLPD
jgi:hypothetical protein